jgi:hypothetical protein
MIENAESFVNAHICDEFCDLGEEGFANEIYILDKEIFSSYSFDHMNDLSTFQSYHENLHDFKLNSEREKYLKLLNYSYKVSENSQNQFQIKNKDKNSNKRFEISAEKEKRILQKLYQLRNVKNESRNKSTDLKQLETKFDESTNQITTDKKRNSYNNETDQKNNQPKKFFFPFLNRKDEIR